MWICSKDLNLKMAAMVFNLQTQCAGVRLGSRFLFKNEMFPGLGFIVGEVS